MMATSHVNEQNKRSEIKIFKFEILMKKEKRGSLTFWSGTMISQSRQTPERKTLQSIYGTLGKHTKIHFEAHIRSQQVKKG